jgi:hypothetical protein
MRTSAPMRRLRPGSLNPVTFVCNAAAQVAKAGDGIRCCMGENHGLCCIDAGNLQGIATRLRVGETTMPNSPERTHPTPRSASTKCSRDVPIVFRSFACWLDSCLESCPDRSNQGSRTASVSNGASFYHTYFPSWGDAHMGERALFPTQRVGV